MKTNDFDRLPAHARIWIYQASRELTGEESKWVEAQISKFTDQWQAHGAQLLAAGILKYNRFVILGVDEGQNAASGCSIDSSVHFIKMLGNHLNVDFFDRMQTAFLDESTGKVHAMPLKQVKSKISEGAITPNDTFFNNLVETKAAFDSDWLIPAGKSWIKNYFVNSPSYNS